MSRLMAPRPMALLPLVLSALVAGCSGGPPPPVTARPGATDAAGQPSVPIGATASAPAPAPPAGQPRTCPGRPPAPALAASDLVGTWQWVQSWLYEAGEEYEAMVEGTLELRADMRWEGARTIIIPGTPYNPTAYGPGSWAFDGYALTLSYDDRSDAEGYDTVRLGIHHNADGSERRNMSLEIAHEDGSCTVYVLQEAS